MKPRNLAKLILLGAVWGSAFLFIHTIVPTFGPIVPMFGRLLIGAVLLVIFYTSMKQLEWSSIRENWKELLLVGLLNNALPFSMLGFSQLHLTASLGSILNATTALFGALFAAIWLGEEMTPLKITGLLVGVGGVAIIVGWSPVPLTPVVGLAIAASLAVAISYSVNSIFITKRLEGVPSATIATGSLIGASFMLLPFAFMTYPVGISPTGYEIAAFITLGVLCTGFAYIVFFPLLEEEGPTKTLIVTYLVPAFGTLWGVIFLGEKITASVAIGFAAILLSVMLVNQPDMILKLFRRGEETSVEG